MLVSGKFQGVTHKDEEVRNNMYHNQQLHNTPHKGMQSTATQCRVTDESQQHNAEVLQ